MTWLYEKQLLILSASVTAENIYSSRAPISRGPLQLHFELNLNSRKNEHLHNTSAQAANGCVHYPQLCVHYPQLCVYAP